MRRPMKLPEIALLPALIPLLVTPGWAQSAAQLGNDSLAVSDAFGVIFEVRSLAPTSEVVLGESGGPNVDLFIKDPDFSVDENAFRFDASNGNLILGSGTAMEDGDDGDVTVHDRAGVQTIRLSGDDGGQAMQSTTGNGFVKAWVRVMGIYSAVILSSYNVSAVERTSEGVYHVTFIPTAFNERPMMAMLDGHDSFPSSGGISVGLEDGTHPGQKQVFTYDKDGIAADRSFNLVVY